MKRGDIFSAAPEGGFGKPRPTIIVQADIFDTTETVIILPLTSTLTSASMLRIDVAPSESNGLREPSQVMIDKVTFVRRSRVGRYIGTLEDDALLAVTRSLAVLIGLAD